MVSEEILAQAIHFHILEAMGTGVISENPMAQLSQARRVNSGPKLTTKTNVSSALDSARSIDRPAAIHRDIFYDLLVNVLPASILLLYSHRSS